MTFALDCCCYLTGFEALLNPAVLAVKAQVGSCERKGLTFPSNKGLKRERMTLCKHSESDSVSDQGF